MELMIVRMTIERLGPRSIFQSFNLSIFQSFNFSSPSCNGRLVRHLTTCASGGVSKGVTLYYFSSKEDLFRELFSWLIDSIQQRMREAVDAVADPVEKVRALVALIFPSPLKNRAFFRAYIDFCGLASRREAFR